MTIAFMWYEILNNNNKEITVNNGYLGSYNDEERSEMW